MSQSKIYVGSLPYSSSKEDLEEHFGTYGDVKEVNLIMDRETGRSKGFAFIEFGTEEAATKSLECDGNEFMGRNIRVSIANKKPSGGAGGGRRDGGGGRW